VKPAKSLAEQRDELIPKLEAALATGRYLLAFWRVEPDGRLALDRVTLDFPKDDFSEALRMLRDNLSEETRRVAVRTMQTRLVPMAASQIVEGEPPALPPFISPPPPPKR
jgi:hypothetical protein